MAPLTMLLQRTSILVAIAAASVHGAALKIMPLGASITAGDHSSTGNGYREDLLEKIQGDGYQVDYVGSVRTGTMADPDNEGFSGLRIDEVEGHAKEDVPTYLPDVYTINLGTNDAGQNYDINNAGARMQDLINYLWTQTPDATIILSTLIINLDQGQEQRTQVINPQYLQLIDNLRGQGKKIVLADMRSGDGPQPGDMADNTHPNDAGYAKMANIWYASFEQARSEGMIPAP